jgi:hypothetical protein
MWTALLIPVAVMVFALGIERVESSVLGHRIRTTEVNAAPLIAAAAYRGPYRVHGAPGSLRRHVRCTQGTHPVVLSPLAREKVSWRFACRRPHDRVMEIRRPDSGPGRPGRAG